MRLYIAGPYGRSRGLSEEELETNVLRAKVYARGVIAAGHTPFLPHLYHELHRGWITSPDETRWFNMAKEWITFCDGILRIPGESVGADKEVAYAEMMGLKVFHNLEEIR
uniref:DUF4406 domain-containing protein n=1 Tax=viral metagenome TaxID=1070528 RepID=A0A6H2A3E6_9ZZZZ